MMHRFIAFSIALAIGFSAYYSAAAAQSSASDPKFAAKPADGAPDELHHFAPMIGRWAIEDWALGADGEWVAGAGADWDFWYGMDGWAVLDLWVRPGREVDTASPDDRFVGMNIRLWDTAAQQWRMTWVYKQPGPAQRLEATSTPDEINMTRHDPESGALIERIRFYNMTGDSFDWIMTQPDENGDWRGVYKLKGTRKP